MRAKKTAPKKAPAPHPVTHGKSLVYGDCMEVMDRWLAEGHGGKADLIYLDPPFNSSAYYNILYGNGNGNGNGRSAQVFAFDDTWTWDEAAEERLADLYAGGYPNAVRRAMEGLEAMLGKDVMLAYLAYMAQRLHRCRLMLADTGGIYLHCDPTASHYLKALMDAIFGRGNFRNEIVWHYGGTGNQKFRFPSKHDILLFYAGGADNVLHPLEVPAKKTSGWTGKATKRCDSVWDINTAFNSPDRKSLTGYPTQKPSALLERILRASSNKGDLVLDPFCGCGTTVVAANKLGRRWIGIDVSTFPVDLICARLHDIRKQIHVEGIPRDMKGARLLAQEPFKFEKWAVMRIQGMLPNPVQTGDDGVDGDGYLEHDIDGAIKPAAAKTPLVIAQVTVSSGVNINKIRALRASMEEQRALFGVYITLEKIRTTPSLRRIAADAGVVRDGSTKYPRLQFWSAAEYFQGREVKLPPLATSRILARGAARAKISQDDLELEDRD